MKLACWNIRNILAKTGSLQEHCAGYTLFWSRKPAKEKRLSGVGFMLRTFITSKLENLPGSPVLSSKESCFSSNPQLALA